MSIARRDGRVRLPFLACLISLSSLGPVTYGQDFVRLPKSNFIMFIYT